MTSISDLGLDLSTTPSSLGEKEQAGRQEGKTTTQKAVLNRQDGPPDTHMTPRWLGGSSDAWLGQLWEQRQGTMGLCRDV